MKVLFLAHRIPFPPDKGDKIRSYNVLKYLARRHDVTLLCPIDQEGDLKHVNNLEALVQKVIYEHLNPVQIKIGMLKNFLTGKPLTVANFWSPTLKSKLDALVIKEKFDAVYVFSSTMAEYVWDMDIPVKIIDFCDLDSAKFLQFSKNAKIPFKWIYQREADRLQAYEQRAAAFFDHILFISAEEKSLFDSNGYAQKLSLMSNGVDLNQYFGDELPARHFDSLQSAPLIAFTGVMDYLPNVDAALWFAKNVMPLLRKEKPGTLCYILGKNPVPKIRALHDFERGIIVTGYVRDMRASLAEADVFVAPMRIARGMQTKILEAMACGVPVVSSPASSRGIGATSGVELLTAETANEFAQKTLSILGDSSLASRLRKTAFDFLQRNFNWESNLNILESMLQEQKTFAQ